MALYQENREKNMITIEEVNQLWQQAKQGNAQAQNNLGLLYLNGELLAQNFEQAGYWFNEAAKKGFDKARLNLGKMYQKGLVKDFSDAPEKAKTPLARRLMQLRSEALAKGMPLLNSDEVNEEVRRRRAGY
jgi:TPR repeat protein